jgi:hypothetical protein
MLIASTIASAPIGGGLESSQIIRILTRARRAPESVNVVCLGGRT